MPKYYDIRNALKIAFNFVNKQRNGRNWDSTNNDDTTVVKVTLID